MVRAESKENTCMCMKRLPEPELMQNPLQVQAYSEADFSNSDALLIRRIEEYLLVKGKQIDSKSLIIDLGCGPGNITELLSRSWPSVRVFGIDGSGPMLAEARNRKDRRKSFNDLRNVSYFCWNLLSIADGTINFKGTGDLIVSNSLLHHFHDPSQFWKALKSMSSKGSITFHRDLRRPSSMDEAKALQKMYLPDSPEVLINDYLASLQAAFTVEEVKTQLHIEGLDHLSVYEVEDRYLEVVGIF